MVDQFQDDLMNKFTDNVVVQRLHELIQTAGYDTDSLQSDMANKGSIGESLTATMMPLRPTRT